ncbi:MAG: DNA-binding protein WhiA [Clostridiales bacterium]|jgi:DNA-binding protein WhiA|nr:DNA-binding protein WhiA [Clostridiales bacterium]
MISKNKVKQEILKYFSENESDDAFLYGVILSFGSIRIADRRIFLSVECDEDILLTRFAFEIKRKYAIGASLNISQKSKKLKEVEIAEKEMLVLLEKTGAAAVSDGHIVGFTDTLEERYLGEREFQTVMRFAFFKNGVVRAPEQEENGGYYLEIVFESEAYAADVSDALLTYGIKAKLVERNESYVVYVKDGESVGAFLALVAAYDSALALQEILVVREERNNAHRRANCDSYNFDKSASASVGQVLAIEKIKNNEQAMKLLPHELSDTALCRLTHHTASISELSELLGVSKGCVQHRLKRLQSIAEKL